MRYLWYTNYQSGNSGLSNGIMSVESGVILAFLTNRMLLLDGNASPPANIVDYEGRVDNQNPSRITDLLEIPVPWSEPGEVDLGGLTGFELTDHHMMDCMFYLPDTVDIHSTDARAFANRRQHWLCESGDLISEPLLRLSEDPLVPGGESHRHNLCFYSYFFYLNPETRKAVNQVLKRMTAKPPYAELAAQVAQDLGPFNAVHMRRGDFKVTYGVTVLDRQPWEAIEALDNHFSRDERLVICTDERNDPFFDEIKAAYSDHIFIDHHILDNYGKAFADLPTHDSIALAHLSQLVAGNSQDFIGTMTSTFTSMIQRYRGNHGKEELFKFLWNEIPEPGDLVERGRHPISDCVPLDRGIMVEDGVGPYTWNRCSDMLNPAWMREWPESFLDYESPRRQSASDSQGTRYTSSVSGGDMATVQAQFEGLQIAVRTSVVGLADALERVFGSVDVPVRNVMDELVVENDAQGFRISRGQEVLSRVTGTKRQSGKFDSLIMSLTEIMATRLSQTRKRHCWLKGMAFRKDNDVVMMCGGNGDSDGALAQALCADGWALLADQFVPIHQGTWNIIPFVRGMYSLDSAAAPEFEDVHLSAIVVTAHRIHSRPAFSQLPPSIAVAELIPHSIDIRGDRKIAVKRMCSLVEERPVYELTFSDGDSWSETLEFISSMDFTPPENLARNNDEGKGNG